MGKNEAKRAAVGLEPGHHPWSQRPGIHLNGLRKQGNKFNRMYELLDHRWSKYCTFSKIAQTDSPKTDCLTDVMKSEGYQKACGLVCMQTNTKLYSHNKDRGILPEEHFAMQGWSLDDISFLEIASPWPDLILQILEPEKYTGAKRRRQQCRQTAAPIRRLAGNAMGLPEVGAIGYCPLLAQDSDIWELPPSKHTFDLTGGSKRYKLTVVDLDKVDEYQYLLGDDDGAVADMDEDDLDMD